jgi:glycosyltransferase involved in cell wall biosynthesis
MRIAHLIHTFPPAVHGGGELFVYELSRRLANKGHEVIVVTRGFKDLPRREDMDGFHVERYENPAPESWKYHPIAEAHVPWYGKYLVLSLDLACSANHLRRLVREEKLDLLHTSFIVPSGVSGVIVKSSTGIPLVITVHGNADFYEVPKMLYPMLRYAATNADRLVAVGDELKRNLLGELGDLDIRVIPNGVDTERYRPAERTVREETRRKHGIPINSPALLSVSRLVERKNIDLVLRAVPHVVKKLPDFKFLIVGEGPEHQKLRQLTHELGVESAVMFMGFVSEEEKTRIYLASDAFIQLSSREGLSISLLESKAAGLPAIVSDSKGTREPVRENKSGRIVSKPEMPTELAEKILDLLSDSKTRRRMGKNARREAEENYSLEAMTRQYIEVYREALESRT